MGQAASEPAVVRSTRATVVLPITATLANVLTLSAPPLLPVQVRARRRARARTSASAPRSPRPTAARARARPAPLPRSWRVG
jgi:hypothetical protein